MTNTKHLALIVPADGNLASTHVFTDTDSYHWLADAVEGMISCVSLRNGIDMWVNDEYLYNGSEMNAFATGVYWDTYGFMSHYVNGNAVFASNDGEGATVGLTIEQFDYLGRMLDEFEILIDLSGFIQAQRA